MHEKIKIIFNTLAILSICLDFDSSLFRFRTYKQQCTFEQMRRAVLIIQQSYRDHMKTKEVAAKTIQRCWRQTSRQRRVLGLASNTGFYWWTGGDALMFSMDHWPVGNVIVIGCLVLDPFRRFRSPHMWIFIFRFNSIPSNAVLLTWFNRYLLTRTPGPWELKLKDWYLAWS